MGGVASAGSDILVYISDELTDPAEIVDTIIHESVHVKQALCTYIQEQDIGAEMEAYTVAYIASTLFKEYERLTASKEKPSAIHEGREEGLQTGVQGVPCKP